jgi:hypothetical protein
MGLATTAQIAESIDHLSKGIIPRDLFPFSRPSLSCPSQRARHTPGAIKELKTCCTHEADASVIDWISLSPFDLCGASSNLSNSNTAAPRTKGTHRIHVGDFSLLRKTAFQAS